MDPYETLELDLSTRSPSKIHIDEIRAAYQALVRKHHPDKRRGGYAKDSANANSKFIAIQEAWEMIGTEEKKKTLTIAYLDAIKV